MKSPLLALALLLVSGLTACHKQSAPAQADMDAETRQKAVEIRAAADKATAAINEAAAMQRAKDKEATAPLPTPAPLK
ncbi:hypothetical protein [Prosthecobacter sp.]|uniref:hypothetical protein n=1 Tax=Prosthecobacter sp. TaxID=1965333 RepID=UPI00248A0B36|nr:hypothetical protein [Prosthecobacter sp.]MDI1314414.1 hypothetical protein [Prosthecobacter sp.]